jgi:hypothetical protein
VDQCARQESNLCTRLSTIWAIEALARFGRSGYLRGLLGISAVSVFLD